MIDRLITPEEAQRKMGVASKSTFWDIVNAAETPRVEYSRKCIRFSESEIDALISKHTITCANDRKKLADGRRS